GPPQPISSRQSKAGSVKNPQRLMVESPGLRERCSVVGYPDRVKRPLWTQPPKSARMRREDDRPGQAGTLAPDACFLSFELTAYECHSPLGPHSSLQFLSRVRFPAQHLLARSSVCGLVPPGPCAGRPLAEAAR